MMLGYMTAKEAKAAGFTHHGKYFGIPVWIAPDNDFMVATKWAPFEYLMSAAHVIEGFLRSVFYPWDEPAFQFLLGPKIGEEKCSMTLKPQMKPMGQCVCVKPTMKTTLYA